MDLRLNKLNSNLVKRGHPIDIVGTAFGKMYFPINRTDHYGLFTCYCGQNVVETIMEKQKIYEKELIIVNHMLEIVKRH